MTESEMMKKACPFKLGRAWDTNNDWNYRCLGSACMAFTKTMYVKATDEQHARCCLIPDD